MAENLKRRHAEESRRLDTLRKAQTDFQQNVEATNQQFQTEWLNMKLQRCRLGKDAAEIKDAIRAGNQKFVKSLINSWQVDYPPVLYSPLFITTVHCFLFLHAYPQVHYLSSVSEHSFYNLLLKILLYPPVINVQKSITSCEIGDLFPSF